MSFICAKETLSNAVKQVRTNSAEVIFILPKPKNICVTLPKETSGPSKLKRPRRAGLFRLCPRTRFPDDENRTRRVFDDALGGAADEQPRKGASAMRPNDD